MAGRFLNLFKPIGRILPEIKVPQRKVKFNEKIFWTAMVLIVFLVMTEIPLYGVAASASDHLRRCVLFLLQTVAHSWNSVSDPS